MANLKKYMAPVLLAGGMLLTLGNSSCADALNTIPDGRLSMDEVWKNADYTEAFFASAFDDVPRKHVNYFWFDNMPSAISDESWSCDDVEGVGAVVAYKGQGSAGDHLMEKYFLDGFDCNYWEKYFRCIRKLNTFMANLPNAAVRDEASRTRMMAEAKILRAFYYLQLVKWYGDVPIIADVVDISSDFKAYHRDPAWKVLKEMCVEPCVEALKVDMPWRIAALSERNRFTRGHACAIISQASLFAASKLYCHGENLWQWATDMNKLAFETLRANDFALYTERKNDKYNSAYGELFAGGAGGYPENKEVIMGTIIPNQPNYWVWGLPIQNNYRAGDVPTQELVDSYDMLSTGLPVLDREQPYLDEQHLQPNFYVGPDGKKSGYNERKPYANRDLRFEATVLHNGSTVWVGDVSSVVQTFPGGNCEVKDNQRTYTRTGYYNNKFRNWYSCASKRASDGTWIYFRMGEVYLNYAECCVEVNDLPKALELMNEIRHRAGFKPAVDLQTDDQNTARLMLRKERRVEFVFEEHRYFDVRRWTDGKEDIQCEKFATGMRPIDNGAYPKYERFLVGTDGSYPSKLSYEAKWHFLPIPLKEATTLEEKTGEKWQNYGW